jgi:hypothetical protein
MMSMPARSKSPIASRVASSWAASNQGLASAIPTSAGNADLEACAREKATFAADEKIYNAFTARAAAQP